MARQTIKAQMILTFETYAPIIAIENCPLTEGGFSSKVPQF